MRLFISFLLSLVVASIATAQRVQPVTSTTLAAPATEWAITSVRSKFLLVDTTTVRVYMSLTTQRPNGEEPLTAQELIDHFLLNYVIYPDYNSRDRLAYGNIPLTAESVTADRNRLVVSYTLKRPKELPTALLLAEFTETASGKKSLNDLVLRFRASKLTDRFALFDPAGRLPQFRNYATVNDTVLIRDVAGTQKTLHLFRYRHEFDPAQSPMNTTTRPAPKSLEIDTVLTVQTNQPFGLPAEGLYFFVEDTTDTYGLGLLVKDRRYPKLTRPEKMIRPVMYMSTGTEINQLNTAKDVKKALDQYWLSLMSGNEEVARRAIAAYYGRVEEANRLFTTYKEGWKTDKGMIYIILGAPDRVQRNKEREVWIYTRRANVSDINFAFNRKPNQFVEDHYELVRYSEYQPIWYPIVEAWRTGAIRE